MNDNEKLAVTYKYLGQTENVRALDKVLEDFLEEK